MRVGKYPRVRGVLFLVAVSAGILLVGSALASDGPAGSTLPGGPLTQPASEQLQALPPDTTVVDCAPGLAKLPAGARTSQIAGYHELKPGRYLLVDGHCAFSPSATSEPLREDNADGP